jgi:hypothetical protein
VGCFGASDLLKLRGRFPHSRILTGKNQASDTRASLYGYTAIGATFLTRIKKTLQPALRRLRTQVNGQKPDSENYSREA